MIGAVCLRAAPMPGPAGIDASRLATPRPPTRLPRVPEALRLARPSAVAASCGADSARRDNEPWQSGNPGTGLGVLGQV